LIVTSPSWPQSPPHVAVVAVGVTVAVGNSDGVAVAVAVAVSDGVAGSVGGAVPDAVGLAD
jgi:hypothetical protein